MPNKVGLLVMEWCPDTSGYYSGKVHPCWTAVFTCFSLSSSNLLDPKRECWGLLGKEQEATTEILWPKESWRNPMMSPEESGKPKVVGWGGRSAVSLKWRGEGLLHVVWGSYPTWPFHYDHCPPTSLCALSPFLLFKRQFPHDLTVPACRSQEDSTRRCSSFFSDGDLITTSYDSTS